MKNNKIIISCLSLVVFFCSCLKKIDIPQSNIITVTFAGSGAKFVTSDITVSPKDSIFFDFTISSPKEMKYVSVQKNGADITRDTLSGTMKTTFSAVKRFAADSAAGVYTYRILAKDAEGIYMGEKTITVTVVADFDYYTLRVLQVPDSIAKTNKCFFSTSTGKTYSYSDGPANSAAIDFGYFYDTTTTGAPKHTIFALTANTFAPYDLSTWTKNATVFKKITTPTFVNITSKAILRSTGISSLASGAVAKVSSTGISNGNLTGVVLIFRTAAGKYGAMTVNYTNQNSPNSDTFINIDVKIER